jgi:uncharacterized protein (DUF697 family)
MSEAKEPITPEENNFITKLMHETMESMTKADEKEALARVQSLRERHPNATVDQLAELVIRRKCLQAGAIGAVTASPTLVPGLGTVVALTFGTAVDIGMMYKLQGELVLELIDLYAPNLSLENKRNILMLITGISIGAGRLLSEQGQEIATKASRRLATRINGVAVVEVAEEAASGLFARSVSVVLGVATVAGINTVTTYTIGRRAQAYLKQEPAAREELGSSLRTISGVDERKLMTWLTETTQHSWGQIRQQSTDLGGRLAAAGQSAKELYVVQANKTGQTVVEASSYLAERSKTGFKRLLTLGKWAGSGVAAGTGRFVNEARGKAWRQAETAQEITILRADAPQPRPTPVEDSQQLDD